MNDGTSKVYPLPFNCEVGDWGFIPKNHLKKVSIKDLEYDRLAGGLYIARLILDESTGIPTHYIDRKVESIGQFVEVLGGYADMCGIVRMTSLTIWVKEVDDDSELNIDHKVMDRFVARLKKMGFGK